MQISKYVHHTRMTTAPNPLSPIADMYSGVVEIPFAQ